ncbi:MAG: prepilin-type N-terminal cleavage/methylation domain-containing protein [Pirellulaceae bacterium]
MMSNSLPTSSPRRNAFTLVEIVISVVLISVLLVGLYSLLSIYRNAYEKSVLRTEESQLIRGLQQQLEADLRSAYLTVDRQQERGRRQRIAPPVRIQSADSSDLQDEPLEMDQEIEPPTFDLIDEITSARWAAERIGLFGNSYGLVVDVLDQPPTASSSPTAMSGTLNPVDSTELTSPLATTPNSINGMASSGMAAEISLFSPPPSLKRRMVYVFSEKLEAAKKGVPTGLIRWEWTDADLQRLQANQADTDLFSILWEAKPDLFYEPTEGGSSDTPWTSSNTSIAAPEMADPALTLMTPELMQRLEHLPEVVYLRFRYFDGSQWQDRWDSQSAGMLPVAVEVQFRLEQPRESEPVAVDANGVALEPDSSLLSESDAILAENAEAEMATLSPGLATTEDLNLVLPNRWVVVLRPTVYTGDEFRDEAADSGFGTIGGADTQPRSNSR